MTVHPITPTGVRPVARRCSACPVRDKALCGCLDPAGLERLARRSRWIRLAPDQPILTQGEASDALGLVVEGQVKIVARSAEGAEQVLGLLGPGEVVGRPFEADLPAGFEAATDTVICWIPRADFEAALGREPEMQRGYLMMVLDALDRERAWAAALRGRSATERLAAWLGTAARAPRPDRAGGGPEARSRPPVTRAVVEIALRRRDVAALLDMAPETFSRALHQIADRRVIRLLSPNRVEVVNRDGLDRLAEPHGAGDR